MHRRERNAQTKDDARAKLLFCLLNYCSFDVLVAVRVFGSVKSLISYARASLAPVVQTLDSAIQRITQLVPVIRIRWIVIYPVDSAIQLLNDLGLVVKLRKLTDCYQSPNYLSRVG